MNGAMYDNITDMINKNKVKLIIKAKDTAQRTKNNFEIKCKEGKNMSVKKAEADITQESMLQENTTQENTAQENAVQESTVTNIEINNIITKMIAYSKGNKHDIAHFLKVYTYARMIGEMEKLAEKEQKTLEIAAVIHDIACPLCREKYGNTNGNNQEKESPKLVENFLKDIPISAEMKNRINYLVSHHHTYTNVNGMDYRILLEADFLVNADESSMSEVAIRNARERIFETGTGKNLLTSIYQL